MGLKNIEPLYIIGLPRMGSLEPETLTIGNRDEASIYYGDFSCSEIKCYSDRQVLDFAISFAAFALKEGEPIDLVTSEDYQKHAEELLKKYKEEN
ncbi:hypothetical protein [Lactococcus petauri]|uniref:Uncharacterized protein n=1 Tax=Lactococcus petauri TaxID=1940789 RepID=A0A252CFB3_9LACT|nr:hypothetical protein [Lactococcus petauri]OUK05241.1 hypothetical protein BZZ03_00555 [Lactococcus petauri]